jgi:hypothetical protein
MEGSGDVASSSQQERRDHELIGGGSDAAVVIIATESRLESSRARGRGERVEWWGDRKLVNAPTKVIVGHLGITNPSIMRARIVGMEVIRKIADRTKRFAKTVS